MSRKTQTTVGFEPHQIEWMDKQSASNAELARRGIEKLMEEENE